MLIVYCITAVRPSKMTPKRLEKVEPVANTPKFPLNAKSESKSAMYSPSQSPSNKKFTFRDESLQNENLRYKSNQDVEDHLKV